jgi:hypothetical protein
VQIVLDSSMSECPPLSLCVFPAIRPLCVKRSMCGAVCGPTKDINDFVSSNYATYMSKHLPLSVPDTPCPTSLSIIANSTSHGTTCSNQRSVSDCDHWSKELARLFPNCKGLEVGQSTPWLAFPVHCGWHIAVDQPLVFIEQRSLSDLLPPTQLSRHSPFPHGVEYL